MQMLWSSHKWIINLMPNHQLCNVNIRLRSSIIFLGSKKVCTDNYTNKDGYFISRKEGADIVMWDLSEKIW